VIAGVQGARDPNEVFPLARDAAKKALAIEPEMSEAFASLACVEAAYDWNWTTAEELFQKAIALNPQYGTAHQWYATHLLIPQGRFAEGKEQIELASANDSLSMAIQITSGLVASFEREPDRAIREYQKALDMDRNFALAHYFLGQAYEQKQSYEQAIQSLLQASELSPGSSEIEAALARAHAMSGNVDVASRMLDQLRGKAALHYVSPVLFAQVLLGLNQYEEAIAELQQAHQTKATDLMWLKVRPAFEVVRNDRRVKLITTAMGLSL
jgi:tetratricopeptide (TPR) repeat protein